jgi:hypothetical protein
MIHVLIISLLFTTKYNAMKISITLLWTQKRARLVCSITEYCESAVASTAGLFHSYELSIV